MRRIIVLIVLAAISASTIPAVAAESTSNKDIDATEIIRLRRAGAPRLRHCRRQHHLNPLARCIHGHSSAILAYHFAGPRDHVRNMRVVVAGIVMEKEQPAHIGGESNPDSILDTRVTPADVFGILHGIVL